MKVFLVIAVVVYLTSAGTDMACACGWRPEYSRGEHAFSVIVELALGIWGVILLTHWGLG